MAKRGTKHGIAIMIVLSPKGKKGKSRMRAKG